MMSKFPIYRKYTNKEIYYKIVSEDEFEELQFIGEKGFCVYVRAEKFPEKLRIQDMINCKDGIWVIITEELYKKEKLFT